MLEVANEGTLTSGEERVDVEEVEADATMEACRLLEAEGVALLEEEPVVAVERRLRRRVLSAAECVFAAPPGASPAPSVRSEGGRGVVSVRCSGTQIILRAIALAERGRGSKGQPRGKETTLDFSEGVRRFQGCGTVTQIDEYGDLLARWTRRS